MNQSSICFCACALFILLSPGVLLSIPPDSTGSIVSVNSGETSFTAVVVHAVVFCVLLKYCCKYC